MKTHRKGFEKQRMLELTSQFNFVHHNPLDIGLHDKMNINRIRFGLHKQIDIPIVIRW